MVPISISVLALPRGRWEDVDQGLLRDQRDLQLVLRAEASMPEMSTEAQLQVSQSQVLSLKHLHLELTYPRREPIIAYDC